MADNHLINPLKTDGFEFVEYTAADDKGIAQLKQLFQSLGFAEVAQHRSKRVWLFKQGDINFIVNAEPSSQAEEFARLRGPSVCGMAFRVEDAAHALKHAVKNGAKQFVGNLGAMELNIPAIYGIGESTLYFVDRYGDESIYEVDFRFYPDWQQLMLKKDMGLCSLDHLTHNVKRGNMAVWANFYERLGNFREIRYFDIEGKLTGLVSKAMTSPCGKIRIPINESSDDKSQIEEFIREYNGEGIQHIALSSEDIYQTVRDLKKGGVKFLHTPDTYYANVNKRVEGHTEDLSELQELKILIDGAPMKDGILLQIFTDTVIGPIFFEIIQRKGNEGFGEGNFKALFESIEQDQIERGVLSDVTVKTEAKDSASNLTKNGAKLDA
ncbi:4-hydroxyphenylpyruvate dioxygenase [Paraglaciecola hydrolytica]|uniref:4-hydroxyphenylpyruvate dioxygenase n=1 Tax=Paraglaciecola hydrolytica TaxID=1799789 RepID=A0A148KNS0_9ALTE|nr:4-hydroxyphenylpyruvate dioxygenase [Paraglaciecola hydrolytica]KXI27976.1 4-hydroxyphenylpyruvate dioxygenase [Paraglaciecola hydrolytica]